MAMKAWLALWTLVVWCSPSRLQKLRSSALSDAERGDLLNRITADVVRLADQKAQETLARRIQENQFFFNLGVDATRKDSAIFMHNLFISKRPEVVESVKDSGVLSVTATLELSRRLGLSKKELKALPTLSDEIPQTRFPCPFRVPACNPNSPFRTPDGSCNNRGNPLWGKSATPLQRFVSPWYQDGISEPRTLGIFGDPLPSPRLVSTKIHETDSARTSADKITHMVMQWGQFIDHDITNTPIDTGFKNADISCCIDDVPEDVRKRLGVDLRKRDSCFPIPIPADDRHFKKSCLNFVRSMQAPNSKCNFGYREQLNQINSFVDASAVYGSTEQDQKALRTGSQGLMKTSDPELLPKDQQRTCILTSPSDYCFKAGDKRVNEQMGLVSIHTVFLREHNRIAKKLARVNPDWTDERLYQETKKTVSAQIQHITYWEWLPTILSRKIMRSLNLKLLRSGFSRDYDPSVDPSIRNVFATAAFRFGHSMVQSKFSRPHTSSQTLPDESTDLKTMFGKTNVILRNKENNVDAFVHGFLVDHSQRADRFISLELTDHLFEDNFGNSLDLASFNIQRGRDHGLPPYNVWREWCGFSVATNFGTSPGGLVDHDADTARRFSEIYSHPDDIDLFSGGISEISVPDGAVGPTFACIIGEQFRMLKLGDSFWYENDDFIKGFKLHQLDEIRKITLSRIICDNIKTDLIQPNSFLSSQGNNKMVACNSLKSMDLSQWQQCEPAVWGPWSEWGRCTSQRQVRRRQCNGSPPPVGCGCDGRSIQFRRCRSQRRCPKQVRFNGQIFFVWGRC